MKAVYAQQWFEYERGWGSRPDGITLHSSRQKRDAYVEHYNKTYNNKKVVPDCYTRASDTPQLIEVEDDIYKEVLEVERANGDNDAALWKTRAIFNDATKKWEIK